MSTSPESSDQGHPRQHSVVGGCPFGHDQTNLDCQCKCDRCLPSTRKRPARITREIHDGIHGIFPPSNFPAPQRERERDRRNFNFDSLHALQQARRPFRGTDGHPLTTLLSGSPNNVRTLFVPELKVESPSPEDTDRETYDKFPRDKEAMLQRPCTEMIPWLTPVQQWTDACEDDPDNDYTERTWPCNEWDCRLPVDRVIPRRTTRKPPRECGEDEVHGEWDSEDEDEEAPESYLEDDPPGDPGTDDRRRYVCEQHWEDSREFWQEENLFNAHLVGSCKRCETELSRENPQGLNTCTCANLLTRRWQCRRCYSRHIRDIQRSFHFRVNPRYIGGADTEMVKGRKYHMDVPDLDPEVESPISWKQIRKMLRKQHPCSNQCGRKRINQFKVMHCTACGGVVVQPRPPPTVAATRSRRRTQGAQLMELDSRGRAQPQSQGGAQAQGRRGARLRR